MKGRIALQKADRAFVLPHLGSIQYLSSIVDDLACFE
jgi:hypothetical protein